jgi:hypothetical protein
LNEKKRVEKQKINLILEIVVIYYYSCGMDLVFSPKSSSQEDKHSDE